MSLRSSLTIVSGALLILASATASSAVDYPRVSPKATIAQTVG
jgi:hypothetical protein